MSATMQPLRDEHKHLLPHIDQLRIAADAVGYAPIEAVRQEVDEGYAFLMHHLLPHAQAEDRALYPVVARLMGAPEATATMRHEHGAIARLCHDLGSLRSRLADATAITDDLARELRRVLYGLHALIGEHFAEEEEVYLPLLEERLTPEEARALFRDMESAAGAQHHGHDAKR
jgi:hemerythrin-like domain-containing protein